MSQPTPFLHVELGAATYEFRRCARDLRWTGNGGIYLFVDWAAQAIRYVGETGNFASRMPGHEVWPEAARRGADEIYALTFHGTRRERRVLERALIGAYRPPCNTQHLEAEETEAPLGRLGFDPLDSFDAFTRHAGLTADETA